MDGKYNEVELLFIREVLDRHDEYLTDLLQDEVIRKRLRISDDLLERMNYRVTGYGIDPGALWKREGNVMTLVDEDEDVRVAWDMGWFEGVEW